MKNETKQDQQYKSAHISALEAIVKRLGKGADREQVLEVVMVMAHGLLTHEQKLDLNLSTHNAGIFCNRLKQLIETTQKDAPVNNGYAGRLM
jgi:hypothetical protein